MNTDIDKDLHEQRMRMALRAAEEALGVDEVPVGAVIFAGNELIARAHNQRELLQDPTAHAEILAITQAAAEIGSWRLDGCTMYVTLEPCSMCAGALILSRIDGVVFGASDPKAGACGSVIDVLACEQLNHTVHAIGGILADECGSILTDFFRKKRQERESES